MKVRIYTDGSAKGNPGPGGYGIVLKYKDQVKEMSQGYRLTTNNRMELLALIVALESLKTNKIPVDVYSDSKYVIDAIDKGWVFGWKAKGFKGKKNEDLWRRFLPLYDKHKIKMVWVKGHAGLKENERCDVLSVIAANSRDKQVDTWYEENGAS